MVAGRRQVLADGQHLDVVGAQVAHDVEDFLVGFAEADHQAGLGRNLRVARLELLEEFQRVRVVGAGAGLLVEARHGFQVVVEHVGQGAAEHVERDFHAAAEIGHQRFDGGGRRQFARVADDVDEVLGAAVTQVVAVDAGNDHIFELERGDRFGRVRAVRPGWAAAAGRGRRRRTGSGGCRCRRGS